MPYMWYPPTFLALPLEIRHNIYSHLLIDRGVPHLVDTDMFRDQETRRARRSIFLTCRKVYHEAFDYYYAKNTFLLSLITPHYSLREVAAKSDLLLRRLQRVQSLLVVIETSEAQRLSALSDPFFLPDTKYPKQQQQWTCFVNLLSNCKGTQIGRILRHLTVEDWGLKQPLTDTSLEGVGKDMQLYTLLLEPLRYDIDEIKIVKGPQKE